MMFSDQGWATAYWYRGSQIEKTTDTATVVAKMRSLVAVVLISISAI